MNVREVIRKGYCLGCGLCAAEVGASRLRMELQENGFYAPVPQNGFNGDVPDLRAYCPGITVVLQRKLRSADEKFYGPFTSLVTAFAKDEQIRHKGSSGGCLTAILCGLMNQNKIDGVLQVKASGMDPVKTVAVFSTAEGEILESAGSRYAPAVLFEGLESIFQRYSRIAVVGKPCDIAGLRQFLRVRPEYSDKIYCMLSFMCMGLPSQQATRRLLQRLGVEDAHSVKSLKYRGDGWPGQATVTTADNQTSRCSYDESWGKILGRDVLFRCKICPDGWGSFADISAGDAWFSDGGNPLFEERPGRSLLFVRTPLGEKILNDVGGALSLCPYDIQELPVIQKSQCARKNRAWIAYGLLKLTGDRALKFKGLGMWNRIGKISLRTTFGEAGRTIKRIVCR